VVVLRGAFDAAPLGAEVDAALRDGRASSFHNTTADVDAAYVPMMNERTPCSLELLRRLAPVAAELLGTPVLPVRAKGVRYTGSAGWHRDSEHEAVPSVGAVAYLEPLQAGNGALRVLPGTQHRGYADAVQAHLAAFRPETHHLPAWVVETVPGDVVFFDEHLHHASVGGKERWQWRADYVADPLDEEAAAAVRTYFTNLYSPEWDGGYDVDRFPTYGTHWQAFAPDWAERLRRLGAQAAADAEEAAARVRRPLKP
jgi:hypothetical protein